MTSREYDAARAAFEGYHDNASLRDFDDLDLRDQLRWLHAAEAVLQLVTSL